MPNSRKARTRTGVRKRTWSQTADKPLEVRVWGDLACFTRPEMKVERVSYPVMTPSAARGVLEAIFWKPEFDWEVEEIAVLKPIRYFSILRNETKARQTAQTAQRRRKNGGGYHAPEDRALRHTLALRDAAYIIRARPVVKPGVGEKSCQVQGPVPPPGSIRQVLRHSLPRMQGVQCLVRRSRGQRDPGGDQRGSGIHAAADGIRPGNPRPRNPTVLQRQTRTRGDEGPEAACRGVLKMLLERLIEYSERLEPAPSLYAEGPVRYWISLDPQGRLLPPVMDTADPSSPKSRWGQRRLLPQVVRSSEIHPLLLADRADYTLGLATNAKRAGRAVTRHRAYVELVERCTRETGAPDVAAVLAFLADDPLDQVQPGDDFDPSGIISFRVDGRAVIDNPAVQAFWKTVNSDPDAPVMQCLVCGNRHPVLARLQARIKGFPGGRSSGTSLISAKAPAFGSYGLTGSLNSPTCAGCGEGFTRGLNALLADGQSRFTSGDNVSVFWTGEEQKFNFRSALEDPDPVQVRALMEPVRTGQPAELDDSPFYAISLSAGGGRATVRDWMDTTVGRVKENLAAWFQGQRIAAGYDGEDRYYGIRALALATVREPRDLPQTTHSILVRAAFTGTPLPMDIMAQAVRRNRTEQRVTRPRAALIKLALLGRDGRREGEYMVNLDTQNVEPAYLCGRLMSLFEEAQRMAMWGINATVAGRFYGTASAAPLSVFPTLLRGARSHLSKLKWDRPGANFTIEARVEGILSKLDARNGFPKSLNLQQQGMFALGYYHQRTHNRERMREAREGKQGGEASAV